MKKSAIFLSIIVLLICFSLAGCKSASLDLSFDEYSSRWMGDIDDNTLLSSVSIPGTHDTGALRIGGIYDLGTTQDHTIKQQLQAGVRFFDIRLGNKRGKLEVYHNFLKQGITCEQLFDDCREFLQNHPTECILMSIKQEHGDSITDTLVQKIKQEPELWYTRYAVPTVGEVRGKIVLFRRFDCEEEMGVNLRSGMPNKIKTQISPKWNNGLYRKNMYPYESGFRDFDFGVHCFVQDYYNLRIKSNIVEGWKAIVDCFEYAKSADKDTYVINFTSCYYNLSANIPLPNARAAAEAMHEYLNEYLPKHPKDDYRIVLFDFVDEELSKSIYLANF